MRYRFKTGNILYNGAKKLILIDFESLNKKNIYYDM